MTICGPYEQTKAHAGPQVQYLKCLRHISESMPAPKSFSYLLPALNFLRSLASLQLATHSYSPAISLF